MHDQLTGMDAQQLREFAAGLIDRVAELAALRSSAQAQPPKAQAKRTPLPAHLPRVEVRHEPQRTVCRCGCAMKRIGEDVSEKLD